MRAKQRYVGDENGKDDGQSRSRRQPTPHAEETGCTHEHRSATTEDHDLSVQMDAISDHRSQAEERGEVEDIGTEDNLGANRRLMVHERRDRGSDLRRVSCQCCHHTEQSFGEPESLTDSLQAGDEDPTRDQADNRAHDEGRHGESQRHRYWRPFSKRQLRSQVRRDGPVGWTQLTHISSSAPNVDVPTRLPGSPTISVPFAQVLGAGVTPGSVGRIRRFRHDEPDA